MEKFLIYGDTQLKGEVTIGGSKNAALPIIAATLLVEGITTLTNVPNISDIENICEILECLGVQVKRIDKHTLQINATKLKTTHAPLDLTSRFRASYYLLGSLIGRYGRGEVGMPGGCAIGQRPIDQHIKGFEALGCEVDTTHGKISIKSNKLSAADIYFDVVSVGATINNILAAALVPGTTTLYNVAKEPHVVDVANFLNSVGADIVGAGTDSITINGVESLQKNCTYSIVPDQIECGTFMIAAAATRGDVLIKNCIPEHMDSLTAKLLEMGATVKSKNDTIRVSCKKRLKSTNINTLPHPGFPTDLQSPMGVLLAIADGTGIINESVWESRFQYTDELNKLGANISVSNRTAVFTGVDQLYGAPIYASDLRAGAALIIAALVAKGYSELYNIQYIDRGYERIEEKFKALGAKIERIKEEEN